MYYTWWFGPGPGPISRSWQSSSCGKCSVPTLVIARSTCPRQAGGLLVAPRAAGELTGALCSPPRGSRPRRRSRRAREGTRAARDRCRREYLDLGAPLPPRCYGYASVATKQASVATAPARQPPSTNSSTSAASTVPVEQAQLGWGDRDRGVVRRVGERVRRDGPTQEGTANDGAGTTDARTGPRSPALPDGAEPPWSRDRARVRMPDRMTS